MSSKKTNPRSKKAQREKNKNPPNNPKKQVQFDDEDYVDSDTSADSPNEAAPIVGRKQAATSPAGSSSAKRTKTSDENTMEVDLENSSKNSPTSAQKTVT